MVNSRELYEFPLEQVYKKNHFSRFPIKKRPELSIQNAEKEQDSHQSSPLISYQPTLNRE
jgi:hypothetical protein